MVGEAAGERRQVVVGIAIERAPFAEQGDQGRRVGDQEVDADRQAHPILKLDGVDLEQRPAFRVEHPVRTSFAPLLQGGQRIGRTA